MRVFLLCLLLFMQNSLCAAQTPLKSAIRSVTVYLEGVQVSREAPVNLQAGEHTLVLQGLPATLDPQ